MYMKLLAKEYYKVKRGISGLGLFAAKDIPKNSWIIEYIGEKIPNEKVNPNSTSKYLFEVNKKWTLNGTPRYNTARYANHSCRPNAESEITKDQVFIKSIKPIKFGEEICYDYGKEFFNEHIKPYGCKCPSCTTKHNKQRTAT